MIATTLHGPNYSSPNNDESSIEIFASIGDAIEALFERSAANGRTYCDMLTLDNQSYSTLFPVFGEGHYMQCYELGDNPDFPIMTEDKILDALAAVHTGSFDWFIALDTDEVGTTYVRVTRG